MPRFEVLLFAAGRETVGKDRVAVTLPDEPLPTAGALREALAAIEPLAPVARSARLAVNHRFASDEQPIAPGDEIALIPPVGGG